MENFKGSKYDYATWKAKDWDWDNMRKGKIFNAPFTEDTLCVFVGGAFNGKVMPVREARERIKVIGNAKDWSSERDSRVACPYPIFDNAPKFDGYIGPVAGTSGCPLRYETQEIYDQLSF